MKILISISTLLLATSALLGVVALPPAGTNDLAAFQANQIHAERYFYSGQIAQLQKQLDTLEIEFPLLAVAVGATGAALVLLAAKTEFGKKRASSKAIRRNPTPTNKFAKSGQSQPERQVKSSWPCFFTTSASRRMRPRWSACRSFLLSA